MIDFNKARDEAVMEYAGTHLLGTGHPNERFQYQALRDFEKGWDSCQAEMQKALDIAVEAFEAINDYLNNESRDSKSPYVDTGKNVARLVAAHEKARKALAAIRAAGVGGDE
jgi:hypothetical protein